MGETQTGLKENVAGVLCYVLGWVSGIVFLILEPKNKTIKFHAFKSIIVFGALTALGMIFGWIPFIGIVFNSIFGVVGFILWIALMVLASQNKKYLLPVVGDYAEKWAG
jgi:uncharacterized membrane protein